MIKKFPLLLLALFYNSVYAQKLTIPNLPKDTTSHYFGLLGQKKQVQNCISPQQRAFVEEQIKKNLIRLGMDNAASRARTAAHPLFVLPLKRAAGFTDPDYYYVVNYVDLNPATGPNSWNQYGSTNLDYTCGNRSYDQMGGGNHTGIDFGLFPFAWHKMANNQVEVIAAAAGTIIQKSDGNDDQSCGSTITGGPNTVTILHADGSRAYYYHLKKNTLTSKAVGQTVTQGEYLGVVGSSGFSTGPHLHFEVWDANFNVIEPFFVNGGCNSTTSDSWWQQQIPYLDKQLVTSSIHDQSPFETCPPSNNNLHFLSEVALGQTPQFYAWGKFCQLNDPVSFALLRPDGSVYVTKTKYLSGNYYAWSLVENIRINVYEPVGEWTYRITYNNQTFDRKFTVFNNNPIPKRLYVNTLAVSGGDGSSWAKAFTNLQQAIDSASVSDEIWVAKGTYYPSKDRYGNHSPTDPRSKTFFIDKEIRILGGFIGNETVWNPKNIAANATILSGDLGIPNDKADNAYNVINFYHTFSNYFTDASVKFYASLTGCTIRDGNANGLGYYPYFSGGGVLVDGRETGNSAEVIIAYCTFENNASNYMGGAIQFEGSYGGKTRGWIDHCTFTNNRATTYGGAILANGYGGSANMLITNSSFTSNTAYEGGAIYNYATNSYATGSQSNATIRNCFFTDNSATNSGGAIVNDGRSGGISNATIRDCKFTSNRSSAGGAIYNIGSTAGTSNATITHSQFISNSGSQGGAIYNDGSDRGYANPMISNCIFTSNTSLYYAGAVYFRGYNGESAPVFINCVFAQNTAHYGGVLFAADGNSENCRVQFLNCTFWSNVSAYSGGIFYSDRSSIFVLNSIIWGNSAVFSSYLTNVVIGYSLVQGQNCSALGTLINCESGMIYNLNPQFSNPTDLDGADDIYGTSDDGLTLKLCQVTVSPAVNTGISIFQSVSAPTTDIGGIPRTSTAGYDMGAYERAVHLDIDTGTVALIQPGSIISQSTITVAAPLNISPVYLKAGTSILLNPGFTYVSTGETAQVFKAEIGECR